jgi:hypothetical protein
MIPGIHAGRFSCGLGAGLVNLLAVGLAPGFIQAVSIAEECRRAPRQLPSSMPTSSTSPPAVPGPGLMPYPQREVRTGCLLIVASARRCGRRGARAGRRWPGVRSAACGERRLAGRRPSRG